MIKKDSKSPIKPSRLSLIKFILFTKIQNKILALVSAICLFSILSMSLTMYFTVDNLIKHTRQSNLVFGADAASGAAGALLEQAHHFLQAITDAQSRSCSNALDAIKFNVLLMEGVVRDIFINEENYRDGRPVIKPAEATGGVYESLYYLPMSVAMNPKIERELKLISNLGLLTPLLADNPQIKQLYVGMESGLFYAYTSEVIENPEYDCRARPWYIAATSQPDDVIFTDVYEDAFGSGLMITAAKAVFDDGGELLGVAALDILLTDLKELIGNTHITNSGYAFILNSEGMYIVHPNMGMDGFDPFMPKLKIEEGDGAAQGYLRMMAGEEGFIAGEVNGKSAYMAFSPISVADWSIGIVVYEDELLTSLESLTSQMDTLIIKSEKDITSVSGQAFYAFLGILIVVIIMVAALAISLSRFISKPIQSLTGEVMKIGEGDFKYRIPVKTYDEIGFLTKAFNDMADNLYSYAQSIVSLNDAKTKLEAAANTDTLTGIFNRRHFMELAEAENDIALKAGMSTFVVIFDLDHFKHINDTYGHWAGDVALKEITQVVKWSIRSSDLFARYGGEEFILLISGVSETSAWDIVERVRQNIHSHPIELKGEKIYISASFGIASASPKNDIETAVLRADESLYKAKNSGRNKSVFHEWAK